MSKQKLKHIRSGVENKKPTPEQIDLGVIAVNFNTNNPFLSIKDSNDEIVSFPSEKGIEPIVETEVNEVAPGIIQEILPTVIGEDYYTKTQTDAEIQSLSASTDTKLEQKANVSDIPSLDGYATEQWVTDQHYLTQHQDISGLATKQEVEDGLAGKSNTGHTHTVSDITNFPSIPASTSDLTNDSGFITSGYTYSKAESDDKYALKGDVPTDVYTKTETDEAISVATQDMATETWVQNQGYLTEHQDISNLATKQEVEDLSGATDTKLASKADITDIPDVSNYFDDAQYDSNTKRINFYHGETIKAYVDATDFIKDGMVDTVSIETLSGSTYLVITFNTDSGKEPINIPIADIFNAANYYTKAETDAAISGATTDMATQTWVTSQGYLTQHQDISNLATKQEVETLSGVTDTKLAGKQDTLVAGENITISGNTISATGGGGSEYTAGTNMEITSGGTINCTIPVNTGTNNSYEDDLLFGTGINIGTNKRRVGIGRNIVFSDKKSNGSVAISPGWTDDTDSQKSHIYGADAISIGKMCNIGEGDSTLYKKGDGSIAIGYANNVHYRYSIAIGNSCTCTSSAQFATAIGQCVKANSSNSFNCGVYNIGQTDTLFELGNGTSISARSNAVEVKNNGDVYIMLDGQMVKLQDHLGGGSITIDPSLDPTSPNAVANSAITEAISAKQDTLIAGEGISISGNTISATGGGGGSSYTAGTGIDITNDVISLSVPIVSGSGKNSIAQETGYPNYENIVTGQGAAAFNGGAVSNNEASGENSFVIGSSNQAKSNSSFAGGNLSVADGITSFAFGTSNTTNGDYSIALGFGVTTENAGEVALGRYNVSRKNSGTFTDAGNTVFSVGVGTYVTDRKNAFEIRTNGDIYVLSGSTSVTLQDYIAANAGGGGGSITIDPVLDPTSSNAVANSAITASLSSKQETLTPGYGIEISGNTISVIGGAGGTQAQADWSQSDNTAVDYIKNKPDLSIYAQSSSLSTVATSGSYNDLSNTPTIPTTTSSVTSGSTECIESGAVYTQFDGMQLKKITQSDYDLLPTKDSNTLYIIINNN